VALLIHISHSNFIERKEAVPMSSFGPRRWQRFPSSATLLTIGALVVLSIFVIWGTVGFIAAP